jgi:hypothetical protein
MSNTINKLIAQNYNSLIIVIFFFGCFLRFYGFNTQGYWFDEWTTLWHANPAFDWNNFYNLRREFVPDSNEYEGTPKLYFFLLRNFFIIFGFTAENGRIFTALFSILALIVSYFLIREFSNNKITKLIVFFLTSANLFLIWEAQETRVQSVVLFFSLLNIFIFFRFLKKNNMYYGFLFSVSIVLLLSISPITFTIILAQLLFLINFFKKRKIIFNLSIVYFISGIIYLYFNLEYLINILNFTGYTHAKFHYHFFIGYFFNSFFGSTFLGAIFLLLFFFGIFVNRKIIFNDLHLKFLLTLIFLTYFLLIIYSFRNGMMAPRYIIFLVPIIIIFIIVCLEKFNKFKEYTYIVIIFFSLITLLNKIEDRPIKKPPSQKIIRIITESGIKNIATNINDTKLFANYFVTHKAFYHNNLIFFDIRNNIIFPKKIWLVCSNNMRADVGTNHNKSSPECYSDILDKNMKITKKIKELDLQLSLYEK